MIDVLRRGVGLALETHQARCVITSYFTQKKYFILFPDTPTDPKE